MNTSMGSSTHLNFLETDSIYYHPCTQRPSSPLKEAQRAAKIISDYGDTVLCLSGGVDSEMMARVFLSCGIKFKVAILRFKNDLNADDIRHAVFFCDLYNLTYEFVDLDIIDFYDSYKFEEYNNKYTCTSPQFSAYLWFLDQLQGYFPCMADIIPIIGSGKASIKKITENETINGFNVYSVHEMNKPLKLNSIDSVANITYSLPNEAKLSLVRYFELNNINGAPLFFKYTPELIYSMLNHSSMKQFIKNKKAWGYENKLDLYTDFFNFPAIGRYNSHNTPIVGFDAVKKHYDKYGEKNECDKRYRYPYVKKNPKNMDRYFIDYKKLTKHLYFRS